MESAQSQHFLPALKVGGHPLFPFLPFTDGAYSCDSPITISGLKHSTLTRFWIDLVNDALNEHVYAANVAGLGHKLSKDGESISISLGGYSDKLPELLKLVLHKMRSIQMDSGRFEYMKEEYLRSIDNAKHSSPLKQAGAEIGWLLSEFGNTDDQRKKAIECAFGSSPWNRCTL